MPGIPKSVNAMNKHPYWFAKLQLGTRFYQWVQLLRNLFDIQKSGLLGNPAVVQNTGGGGNTQMEHGAFDYMVDGAVYSKALTQDIAVAAGAATGAAEYKCILISVDDGGTLTQTVSDAHSAAPVPIPDIPNGDCPVASVQIPPSFVPGTTAFTTSWVTNGYSGRMTASKPETLPDTDI